MKYGIPSLIEYHTAEEHMRFCADNGFDFFEMNLSFPWFQSDTLDIKQLVALRREYKTDYTIHLHDQLNPFDFSPEIREGAMKSIDFALGLAERTGAKRLTLHLQNGMYSSVAGKKLYAYEVCSDRYLANVREMARTVSSRLAGTGTYFCIENTSGFRPYHKKAVDLMLEYSEFGLTFDVGHNYKASEDDESFILERSDRVKHFHIHDVTEKANHVALGTGVLDVARYLNLADTLDCSAVIEVKESSALLQSRDFIYNMRRR